MKQNRDSGPGGGFSLRDLFEQHGDGGMGGFGEFLLNEIRASVAGEGGVPDYVAELIATPLDVDIMPLLGKEAAGRIVAEQARDVAMERLNELVKAVKRMAKEHTEARQEQEKQHDECHATLSSDLDSVRNELGRANRAKGRHERGLQQIDHGLAGLIDQLAEPAYQFDRSQLMEQLEQMRDYAADAQLMAQRVHEPYTQFVSRYDTRMAAKAEAERSAEAATA